MVHLLHDAWIPVIRRNGKKELITPDQVTSDYNQNPVQDLDAPRPDFNGALIQFFIGLVQTTMAPPTDREWIAGLELIPDLVVLKQSFERFNEVFNLDGDGPRFMQEMGISDENANSIDGILIEMPGENTIKKNTDFFVKRESVKQMCPSCAAMALFTLQVNGPAVGKGYKTGLRGGGPLSSIILGKTLWETIWLNIIPENKFFDGFSYERKISPESIFPWMGKIRTSEKKEKTGVMDVSLLQMFWGMGGRILLDFEKNSVGSCDVCGLSNSATVLTYHTKPYGVDYDETWENHTLTPYYQDKEVFRPVHLQPGGITYRHFLGMMINDSSRNIRVSKTVNHFTNNFAKLKRKSKTKMRLWSFGYDMDNAKARCWYESRMPLYLIEDEKEREIFEEQINKMVLTADYVLQMLSASVRQSLSGKSGGGKEPVEMRSRFWNESEDNFFIALDRISGSLHDIGLLDPIKREWLRVLNKFALVLFDQYAQVSLITEIDDGKRIVDARGKLIRFTGEGGKKIQTLLGLLLKDSKQENN